MSQQSASASVSQSSETSSIRVEYVPIIHLMRHAQVCQLQISPHVYNLLTILHQSEHKPKGYKDASPEKSEAWLEMKDPKLTNEGETECIEFLHDFQRDVPNITHILTSPLSRCLDTVKFALQDVLKKGVIVVPMAEVQTLGGGRNGTGLSVPDLRSKYKSNSNILQHKIDWRFLREDWSEDKDVAGNKGKWGGFEGEWRKNYVKGFLRGIVMTKKPGERMEILVVAHGSFFRTLLGADDRMCSLVNLSSLIISTCSELR
jgi:broad specificity phosphatase PhoE